MSASYTLSEIAENNGKNGTPIWLIVRGVVYDMTKFLQEHPGGEDTILEYAGKDATKAFNEVGHSTEAIKEMKNYKVGVVAAATTTTNETATKVQDSIALHKQLESEQSSSKKQKKRIKLFFCF